MREGSREVTLDDDLSLLGEPSEPAFPTGGAVVATLLARSSDDRDFRVFIRAVAGASGASLLARFAAPEAQALWPEAQVRVLEGGNAAWFAASLPEEKGVTRPTASPSSGSHRRPTADCAWVIWPPA